MMNLDMNTILSAINNHSLERQQENAMLMALMGMAQPQQTQTPVQQNYQQPATQQNAQPQRKTQQAPAQPQQKKAPVKQKPTTVCGALAERLKVAVGAITSVYNELVEASDEAIAKKIISCVKKSVDAGRIRKYDAFKNNCLKRLETSKKLSA